MKFFWLVVFLPSAAMGQSPALEDYTLLGAGVRTRPAYDGSASQTVDVIPLVRYYAGALFARTTQGTLEGGPRLRLAPGLVIGAQLAYQAGRKKSEPNFLPPHAVPDVEV